MADKITVLLADDHALVRKGFRRMLEDDRAIQVVGEASDGNEAVRLALELRPNVTVMDCALPGVSGIEAARQIRAKDSEAIIVMLSMHSEDTLVRQALEAGARGYILKNAIDLDLVAAVKKTRFPHTTGEDQPTPGTSATHSTFSVFDQLTGRFGFSEIGFEFGPRTRGQ